MPTRRQLIGAGAASVALTAAAAYPLGTLAQDDDDDNQSSGNRVIGTPMLQPEIDLTRAQEIALEGNAGAAVTKVELEGDDGVLKYDVHLNNGVEVEIDATTGAVIRTDRDDDDDDDGNDDSSTGSSGSGDDGDDGDDD